MSDPDPPADLRTERNATVVIAVVVAGAALYWLGGIITPFLLAFFLLIMIDGLEQRIADHLPRMPGWAPLSLAIGLILLAFGVSVYVVAANVASFAGELTAYAPRLNGLIQDAAGALGLESPPTLRELFRQANPQRFLTTVVQSIQGLASDAVFILIYLGFLLASRRGFQVKARALFGSREERKEAGRIFDKIRSGAQGYLWIQTVTGAMIAGGCWLIMVLLGLDHALFWAFFIFLTGYIPIVGPAIGTFLPAVFALVQYDSYWQPLALFVGLQGVNFFVGNVIYPRMQGRSLNLDPVVVLLSLAFWTALWGLTGAFLSTPLTLMAMVLLAQFEGSKWAAILLSQNGDPDPQDQPKRRERSAPHTPAATPGPRPGRRAMASLGFRRGLPAEGGEAGGS